MRWRKVFGLHKSDRLLEPLMRRLNPRVPEGRPVPHYQPRVLLSAVMICRHPDVVLSGEGEREERLKAAARRMLEGLRALVLRLAYPGRRGPRHGEPFQELLSGWDGAWVCYLSEFVLWKQKDAAALEEELIDMAVKMELSMLEKCGGDPKSPRVLASIDLKAIVDQVPEDHRLLQERIAKLTGAEGLERMKSAVSKARENFNRQHNRSREHCNTENESSVAGFACVSSMSRIPSGLHSPTWAITRDHFGFVSNEAMVHEMLYNPSWQLETDEAETGWELAKSALSAENPLKSLPQFDVQAAQAEGDEALAASVRRHVARVAEQAFWDNVEEGLKGLGGSAPPSAVDRAASLLSELGREVAGVLPEVGEGGGVAAEVSEAFAKPELLRALESADSVSAVGRLLAKATDLMRRLGSPARLDGMLEAQTAVEAQLAAASADGRGGGPTTARVTARALRLLFAQLRLLKLDSANARLRTLSSAIGGGEAARYCASRFRQRQGLPEDGPSVRADARLVAGKLPKTASWLQGARRAAVGAEQGLISAGIELPAHTAAAAAAPQRMQAGRGSASEAGASGPVPPIAPAPPSSWRGTVRLGLVGLVTSEVPAAGPELAETLELDSRRLHSAQNEVQRLMVLSACMLVLRQTGSIAGRAVGPAELEAAKNRLSPILKDPSGNLRDAAVELAAASGGSEDAAHGALRAVLSPSSGALAALAGGLGSALSLYLLMPGGVDGNGPAEAEVERSLSRCGGTVLRAEVQSVAKDVAQIAAVTEAVHGAIYETLYSMDRA
uniref:T-complex protein 11 n=1 Tax=Tetraselmis sp. GSL018 TaxID=582737 RepID=A0A061SEL8_9CHLO